MFSTSSAVPLSTLLIDPRDSRLQPVPAESVRPFVRRPVFRFFGRSSACPPTKKPSTFGRFLAAAGAVIYLNWPPSPPLSAEERAGGAAVKSKFSDCKKRAAEKRFGSGVEILSDFCAKFTRIFLFVILSTIVKICRVVNARLKKSNLLTFSLFCVSFSHFCVFC